MLEDLNDYKTRNSTRVSCRLMVLRDTLSPSDQTILDDALADRLNWSTHALWSALVSKGLNMGYNAVYRHREDMCACGRSNA